MLFRLNSDYNPLYTTSEPGKQIGYNGIINHGILTYNLIAHE